MQLLRLFKRIFASDAPHTRGISEVRSKTALRYYVYISTTKVDMLFPQIPAAFLKGAEAELKINLGVVSTSIKGKGPEDAKELAARVGVVEAYLKDQEDVGTVENPKRWIEGIARLRWGCVQEYASDIAFFGGKIGGRTVALLGSSESVLGAPQMGSANHAPFYYTLQFFNQMLKNRHFKEGNLFDSPQMEGKEGKPPYYSYPESIQIAYDALAGSEAILQFSALVLHTEKNLIVATPLYVALAN